jgi:hypothetical protein
VFSGTVCLANVSPVNVSRRRPALWVLGLSPLVTAISGDGVAILSWE